MDKPRIYALMVVLFFIVGLTVGYFAGNTLDKSASSGTAALQEMNAGLTNENSKLKSENAMLQSQIDKAKSQFSTVKEMRFVPGKVTSIKEGSLVIELDKSLKNPFEDIPMTRTVLINSSTQIVKFEQKTQQEIQEDILKYNEFIKTVNNSQNYPPPSNFKESKISLNSIIAGSLVVVDAGKDVKNLSEFAGLKITLQK